MNLIYVADPMCSWCYGFGKSLDALLAAPPAAAAPLQLRLVMGGLRPYTTEPMAPAKKNEILGHWRRVQEASGQPFITPAESALAAPDFVYDTEPASRATVAVRTYWPERTWPYFKSVQRAFYAAGRNVVRADVLAELAAELDVPVREFAQAFDSDEMRAATRQDFAQSQAWGILGFPALIAERGDALHLVAHGYMNAEALHVRLVTFASERVPAT
ncbi:MAG TPA: DsbA family protein [Burkholderiaceae bacterium]|nr:DsbA family protein [Burkholderiaceae bacterium]